MTVEFCDCMCKLVGRRYAGDRRALVLTGANTGLPVCTASVNLPDEECAYDEIFIKDYSENSGIMTVLINAGVIERPHRKVRSEYVVIPCCRLTAAGLELWGDVDVG